MDNRYHIAMPMDNWYHISMSMDNRYHISMSMDNQYHISMSMTRPDMKTGGCVHEMESPEQVILCRVMYHCQVGSLLPAVLLRFRP